MGVLPGATPALMGFSSAVAANPVSYSDDDAQAGTAANPSTATITADTKTDAIIICLANFTSATTFNITSGTLDGNAMTLLHTAYYGTSGSPDDIMSVGIFAIRGNATAKTVSVSFDDTPNGVYFLALTVDDLQSLTPLDTDDNGGTSGTSSPLSNLTVYDTDGITICAFGNVAQLAAVTWTNATEIRDANTGQGFRGAGSVDLGHDPAGTVDAAGASNDHCLVGVTLR